MAQSVIINNVIYSDVPEVNIPLSGGGTARFYDISDASAAQNEVLSGKSAYISSGKINGSMANNGNVSNTISTKAGSVVVPSGYTSGGTITIASAQQNLLVSGNIKSGVTILGVQGDSMVVNTTISSGGAAAGNILSGYSAYVNGSLINGNAVMPTVSQNSTTKVLSIS